MIRGLYRKAIKLRAMSGAEILFRIRALVYQYFELLLFHLHRNRRSDNHFYRSLLGYRHNNAANQKLERLFWDGPRDRFFTETYQKNDRIKRIKAQLDCGSLLSQANRLIDENRLELLGLQVEIPFNGGWHRDPVMHQDWPHCFYATVAQKVAFQNRDVKYIWEVNRHQFLIILAKAYWISSDERYVEKIISAISSWINENPRHVGVNWSSSLELAVRIQSWIWIIFLCQNSPQISGRFLTSFLKSIYEQTDHIANHLSYYESPYNHLIGEAAALHWVGSLVPIFKDSEKWEKLGWSILENSVDTQFHADGMSVEQASFYHHFTLGFYLQSIFLRRINHKPIPEKVLNRVERACEFSMYMTKPDGTLPMIGDIDNARSIYFDSQHHWDFRSFLNLGAVLFDRPDFKQHDRGLCEETLWLASSNDLKRFDNIVASTPSTTSAAFYQSGYFISRDNWEKDSNYFCFDCGDIAAGLFETAVPSAAHGHADVFSFELVVGGKSFIVDGGFFTYFGALEWHRHFRQEESHNSVRLGHHRQATYCGRLTWQHTKCPELLQWESTDFYDLVCGRLLYSDKEWHQRQLSYIKNHFWFIRDTIQTKSSAEEVSTFLHFAPDLKVTKTLNSNELVASRGNIGLLIKFLGNADLTIEKGGKLPSSGWVGHGYGIRFPSWRAVFSWELAEGINSSAIIMIPFNINDHSVYFVNDEWHYAKGINVHFYRGPNAYNIEIDKNSDGKIIFDRGEIKIDYPDLP